MCIRDSQGARTKARGVFEVRPLVWLGGISYGVYLWHLAVVNKLAKATAHWMDRTLGLGVDARFLVLFTLGAAGAVAIASLSYYLVERPALTLKRLGRPAPATTLRRG